MQFQKSSAYFLKKILLALKFYVKHEESEVVKYIYRKY